MNQAEKKKNDSDWNPLRSIAVASGAGFTMLTCIGLGVYAGLQCDDYFDSTPLGLIFFSILGGAAGLWSVIHQILGK